MPYHYLLFTILAVAPAAVDSYQDTKFGFRFDAPPNWKQVAGGLSEPWVLTRFQCDKVDIYIDNKWGGEHRAELTILGFATGGEKSPFKGELNNPHANYKEYLDKKFESGYHYESENKETPFGSTKVHFNDIHVAAVDNATSRAARRIVSWTYHLQDVDVVAQFEIVESAYAKRQIEADNTFRSFKTVARAEATKTPAKTTNSSFEELQKLTPEERKTRRAAMADAAYAKAKSSLPPGWTAGPEGRFFVLNHADQKFMLRVVNQGNAIFEWLDKNFDFIGKGEFVRKPILRICSDSVEHRSTKSADFWWGGTNLEIITFKDEDDGVASSAFRDFNKSVLKHWLSERDPDFSIAMPDWLEAGIFQVFEYARMKDGFLIFPMHVTELENVREIVRLGKNARARDYLTNPPEQKETAWRGNDQKAALVRFFIAGPGSKETKYKDVFRNYIKNYRYAIQDAKKESGGPGVSDDGEQGYKNRQTFWKGKLKTLFDKTAERTFSTWRDADWKALDAAYFNSLTIQ